MDKMQSASIDVLNSLLRHEISAVLNYKRAMTKLPEGQPVAAFEELQVAHAKRAQRLRKRVEQLGGTPNETCGSRKGLTKIIAVAGAMFGAKLAVSALEEEEDRGLFDYRTSLDKLDDQSRDMVLRELLPAQELTHSVMRVMKQSLRA
ncbi:MAG TPA: ferritin-like domain-containing protein [Trichormus sp.]|jgi:bacterioferritin (cytochrome b1)